MANGWTPERKARQSALIRAWKPWERSTGPKTAAGKAESSKNRQRALDAARQEIESARKALVLAERNLERLGQKPRHDLMAILAMTKHF
ncbi:hypothetical protein FEMY_19490 [Ferrovum myxofaciens]|uniref:Uncharacterized protein n=1 Tax=Ferrovum myxofaciens TaxID=416213 RepID=A0A149VWC1_9PROT|nr:hypothetical protein [Ferrovum myxofaciens]KXW57525.1 hypothetical protein FEMY_19490 [Ferrovum myxofaciens]